MITSIFLVLVIIFGVVFIALIVLTIKFRKKFIEMYPQFKRFYDYILLSLIFVLAGNLVYIPSDISSYLSIDLIERHRLTLLFMGHIFDIFAVIFFILGWARLLESLIKKYRLIPIVVEFKEEPKKLSPGVYICEDKEKCHSLFLELLKGRAGVIISRDFPDSIRKKLKLQKTPILWLTKVEGENNIHPRKLEYLMQTLVDFMKKEDMPKVILFDGFEYLLIENGFNPLYKFLTTIKDYSIVHDTIALVLITRRALGEREYSLLKREFLDVNELLKS
jgi:hypothetical protein